MRLINTLLLLFVILIGFVIVNDLYTTYKWNQNIQREMQENLKNKVTIAYSVLLNELDKFEHLALIVGELNSKLLPLLEYDNYHSINIVLKNISSLYDIDLMYLLNDENILSSSNLTISNNKNYLTNTTFEDVSLKNNKAEFINISPKIFAVMPQFIKQSDPYSLLAIRSIVKLRYDNGDVAGHIVMLKIINHNRELIQRISKLVKANVLIINKNKDVVLTNYPGNISPDILENKNKQYLSKKKDLLDREENKIASLVIFSSEQELEAQYTQLTINSFLPLIITSLLATILFFILKYRVFDYVKKMIDALKKVANGDLKTRVELPSGQGNEIANMMVNFNDTMEKLEQGQKSLKKLNQQKNKLLGIAAHDIRGPLGGILANLEIFQDKDLDLTPDKKDQCIKTAYTTANHLLTLVNDLLDASVIETGELSLQIGSGNIRGLLEQRLNLYELQAKIKNIHLIHNLLIEPQVLMDNNRITQVIDNLINNAIKFTPPGSSISVQLEIEKQFAKVSVFDQGPGFTKTEQQYIFSDASKLDHQPTAGEKSTCLGIAIARKIIATHNGELSLKSLPGKGAQFSFTLPLAN
ncbi:MAG: HAMP domain-containing sensor histidine kinase [Pseudomonadota bacterium]